ncbi:MAG: hypothetical protein IPO32_03745 [Crocinitomicaceae bacterium]|nr:hypothetical protein [Crocinitomicaceae bacterium]
MKNILLIVILSAFPFSASHAQTFSWAKSFGNSGGFQLGLSNCVDAAGNVYTTGIFHGTVDFDPGAGTKT